MRELLRNWLTLNQRLLTLNQRAHRSVVNVSLYYYFIIIIIIIIIIISYKMN